MAVSGGRTGAAIPQRLPVKFREIKFELPKAWK
jgi:hypothetical protein